MESEPDMNNAMKEHKYLSKMKMLWKINKRKDKLDYPANYEGTWTSIKRKTVKGTISVYFPINPKMIKVESKIELKCQMLIHYDKNCVFRTDWKVKTDIIGSLEPKKENLIDIKFKTLDGNQIFEALDVELDEVDCIIGTYKSLKPIDNGLFQIKLIN